MIGVRTAMLSAYGIPAVWYEFGVPRETPDWLPIEARIKDYSAKYHLNELGCLIWNADRVDRMSRKKRTTMDVPKMIEMWREVVVGLALAHDKDEADRFEAQVNQLLTPILAAPIKQVREFAYQLADVLESDRQVPLLVHKAFRMWVDQMKGMPDEGIKVLKTDLAQEIVNMVEDDAKRDLPAAMVRALQWRSPEQLGKVKEVVQREKEAGRPVHLRGRESCLFLEAGGTEETPEVCVQV